MDQFWAVNVFSGVTPQLALAVRYSYYLPESTKFAKTNDYLEKIRKPHNLPKLNPLCPLLSQEIFVSKIGLHDFLAFLNSRVES